MSATVMIDGPMAAAAVAGVLPGRVGMTPALVVGSGVTALGVIRALGRAGVPLLGTARPPDLAARSRWFRAAPPLAETETLAAYLARIPIPGAVVIPCSDRRAREAADTAGPLADRFPASVAAADVMRALTDKERFSALVRAADVPHPRTFDLDPNPDLGAIPDDVWTAAFLKPRDSQAFFARFGVKAFWVRSREEAGRRLNELTGEGFAMVVQEYVSGPSSNHYFVDGFADRQGTVRAVLARRRLRMHPPDFGNSSYMVTVALAEAAGAVAGVRRLLEHTRYRGAFSAEFKRDARDGTFRILEVNARPWWYVEFAARCGVNVPRMMYDDALGRPVPDVAGYRVGVSLVYPYYDFLACRAARREGRLSLGAWARSWADAMQPIFAWDDPAPAARAGARWIGGWVRRRLPGAGGRA